MTKNKLLSLRQSVTVINNACPKYIKLELTMVSFMFLFHLVVEQCNATLSDTIDHLEAK